MSNALAIATVTGALYELLRGVVHAVPGSSGEPELPETDITRKPLDLARDSEANSQLNLFLYQISPNAADSNGRSDAKPLPLSLNLHYLLTAYGKDGDDLLAHRLLGRAVRALHDQPVLGSGRISDAIKTYPELAGGDLHLQKEHIRITPLPLSMDELTKLWGACHGRYRLSLAYQVTVVFIDSTLPAIQAKPVAVRQLTVAPDR